MKLVYIQGMRSFSETFIRSEKAYLQRRHEVRSVDLTAMMTGNPFLAAYHMFRRVLRGNSACFDRQLLRFIIRELRSRKKGKWKLLGIWMNLDLLANHLERMDVQRMVLHFLFDTTLVGYLLCRKLGIPYYLRLHTRIHLVSDEGVKEIIDQAFRVYAISKALQKHFSRFTIRPIQLLPQRVLPVPKQMYKMDSGPTRMLSACRWIPKKGLVPMIDALAQLPGHLHWQWIIYGAGPEEEAMRKAIERTGLSHRIILNPKVSHWVLLDQLGKAHILLAPSIITADDEDGVPTVIPEAMLRKTLVVSTPVGGIQELIEHGKTGFLVDMENRPKLVEQMQAILENKNQWEQITEQAESVAHKRYVEEWEFEI